MFFEYNYLPYESEIVYIGAIFAVLIGIIQFYKWVYLKIKIIQIINFLKKNNVKISTYFLIQHFNIKINISELDEILLSLCARRKITQLSYGNSQFLYANINVLKNINSYKIIALQKDYTSFKES